MMLQKKLRKRPFMFGGIVHEILEAHAEGLDWEDVLDQINLDNKKLFKKEIQMYGNIISDIRFIMTDYFDYWDDHPSEIRPIKHDGRRSEHEFRIELADGLWFTGRIDMVGKAKGLRWVVEHKTFSRMPSEDERWRNVQGSVYFRALEEMGFKPFDGVLWDYVNSKPPSVPGELTSTGKISQKRIDSVPSKVKAWLKENGYKKKDYPKLVQSTEDNLPNRFIRIFTPVKRNVVDQVWADFCDTALEIQQYHGLKKDQNIGRHCAWCDFQALCKAEVTGSDVEWLIERDFQKEDQSHKREQVDRDDD